MNFSQILKNIISIIIPILKMIMMKLKEGQQMQKTHRNIKIIIKIKKTTINTKEIMKRRKKKKPNMKETKKIFQF